MSKWEALADELGVETEGKTPEEIKAAVMEAADEAKPSAPELKDQRSEYDQTDPKLDELKKLVADLKDLAGQETKTRPEKNEQAEKLLARIQEVEKSIRRKIKFVAEPSYRVNQLVGKTYQDIIEQPTEIPIVKELQEAHETIAFVHAFKCATSRDDESGHGPSYDRKNGFKTLKSFRKWDAISRELQRALKDASDPMGAGISGFGAQWVPTLFTSEMLDTLYRQQLKIVPLFRTIAMPHSPYTFPVQTTKAVAVAEAETTSTPDSAPTMMGADPTNPATAAMTLTAKKYAVKVSATAEAEEESIVPIIPFLRAEVAAALAEGEEKMILNGEAGTAANGTAGDYDITGTAIETLVLGLRFFGIDSSATHNAGGDALVKADLDAALKAGGKWFARNDQTVIVMGFPSWWNLMIESNTPIMDASKTGATTPLLTGQLGAYMGKPIIVSEFIRENVTLNGYNENGGTNTFTYAIIVNPTRFFWGTRRAATIEGVRLPMNDLSYLIARKRSAFQAIEAAGASVEYCRLIRNVLPS